jgi:plasmid stabilization system protein ParE
LARLIFSQIALVDLEKLTDFLIDVDPLAAAETVDLIEEAIGVLKRHPLIGRQVFYDGLSGEFYTFALPARDSSCAVCGSNPTIKRCA